MWASEPGVAFFLGDSLWVCRTYEDIITCLPVRGLSRVSHWEQQFVFSPWEWQLGSMKENKLPNKTGLSSISATFDI